MREWRLIKLNDDWAIVPTREFVCPFCGEVMILHDFRAYYSTDNAGHFFYHTDVHMKCPKCSFWAIFGVPISKEEYDKLVTSKLNGKILIYQYKDNEKLAERIREWGYW